MMCGRMMLGKIVGQIREAGSPVNNKLFLFDAFLNPVETHINVRVRVRVRYVQDVKRS
jgi:hypothetical protein